MSFQVKQEPGSAQLSEDYRNSQSFPANNNNSSAYSNGTVSSTTSSCGGSSSSSMGGGASSSSTPYPTALPSLKSFATPPKYLTTPVTSQGGSKKRVRIITSKYEEL